MKRARPRDTSEQRLLEILTIQRGGILFCVTSDEKSGSSQRQRLRRASKDMVRLASLDVGAHEDWLARIVSRTGRGVLFVTGLDEKLPRAAVDLNLHRERFASLTWWIVFWITPASIGQIAQKAPDFWAWRTAVIEFGTAQLEVDSPPIVALTDVSNAFTQPPTNIDIAATQSALEQTLRTKAPASRTTSLEVRLAMEYFSLGQMREAREHFARAISLIGTLEDEPDHSLYVHAVIGRGLAQLVSLQYRDAIVDLERGLTLLGARLVDAIDVAWTRFHLGEALELDLRLEDAEAAYVRVANVFRLREDAFGQAVCINRLACLKMRRGDSDAAESLFRQAIDFYVAIDDAPRLAGVWNNLGLLLAQKRRYAEAIDALETAEALKQAAGDLPGLSNVQRNLAIALERVGETSKAARYRRASHSLTDLVRPSVEALDRRWLDAVADGDEAEASRLMGLCQFEVRRRTEGLLSEVEREDLASDVFADLLLLARSPEKLAMPLSRFIGRFLEVRVGRKYKRVEPVSLANVSEELRGSDADRPDREYQELAIAGYDPAIIQDALADLNDYERELVDLRFFGGRTVPEVASVLDQQPARLYREYTRIYRKLRAYLGGDTYVLLSLALRTPDGPFSELPGTLTYGLAQMVRREGGRLSAIEYDYISAVFYSSRSGLRAARRTREVEASLGLQAWVGVGLHATDPLRKRQTLADAERVARATSMRAVPGRTLATRAFARLADASKSTSELRQLGARIVDVA